MVKIRREKDYKVVDKSWGMEQWVANLYLHGEDDDTPYCFKILTCIKGLWSSERDFHKHPKKDETFFMINGILRLEFDAIGGVASTTLSRGDSVRIKPGLGHRFKSLTSHSTFLEISTVHDDEDVVRYKREEKEAC